MAIAAVEVQVFFSAPRCGNYRILMESCFILVYEGNYPIEASKILNSNYYRHLLK